MEKILVIEDQALLLEEVSDILRFANYEVIGAENGLTGLQKAREELPDLIICDVMMPGIDGFEVLKDLRNDSRTVLIPFIFLTAKTAQSDRRKGMNLGADDYLTKPFTNSELLSAIRARLSKQAAVETQRLRAFSHKLIQLQENERQQMASRLQNEVVPLMDSLQVTLKMSRQMASGAYQPVLEETLNLAANATTMLNDITQDLWPAILDHLGLLPALFWLFERYTAKTGVTVNFHHAGLQRSFKSAIKMGLYRVIQAAVDNIARHAGVEQCTVQVWVEDELLHAQVIDEGTGFDLDAVFAHHTATGLIAMQERLIALTGELNIITAPEQGTQVFIKIPIGQTPELPQMGDMPAISGDAPGEVDAPVSLTSNIQRQATTMKQTPAQHAASSPGTITILLADANEIMRNGLKIALEAESDMGVIAEIDHENEVVGAVQVLKPDVMILDLDLLAADKLDIIRQITQEQAGTHVLILSSFREEAYSLEAFRAGAAGYILRNADSHEFMQAIREIHAGRRYLSPAISEQAIEAYLDMQRQPDDSPLDTYGTLTNREREIMHFVLDGSTSAEIAKALVISPRTVETHRTNMMKKLGVHNHRELLRYALRRGIIDN